jgi:hypothetical protein
MMLTSQLCNYITVYTDKAMLVLYLRGIPTTQPKGIVEVFINEESGCKFNIGAHLYLFEVLQSAFYVTNKAC